MTKQEIRTNSKFCSNVIFFSFQIETTYRDFVPGHTFLPLGLVFEEYTAKDHMTGS